MKSLTQFIKENLKSFATTNDQLINEANFSVGSWSHDKKYDYPKMVIQDILDGKDLLMGKEGNDPDNVLKSEDFDHEKLQYILDHIDEKSDEEMINDFNSAYKKEYKGGKWGIWGNIFKGAYSGQTRKIKGGLEFEDVLATNLQKLILGQTLDDNTKFKDVSEKLFSKIKSHYTIKKLQSMNLDEESIKQYVRLTGEGTKSRNQFGQILNLDTFAVNINKKITSHNELTNEDEVIDVLEQSGKIIADVTITLDGDAFDKSSKGIRKINPNDIYISCKDGQSQFSTISMQQPFYGNGTKTGKNYGSWMIECYNAGKPFEEFKANENDICVTAFHNMCNLFGIDEKTTYDYFSAPKEQRKTGVQIKVNKEPEKNDELFATMIQLMIGGNYWYVNSDGVVAWIDKEIEDDLYTFVPSGTGHLDPLQIAVTGEILMPNGNKSKVEMKFRNSQHGDYPFRLFVVPSDKHLISHLFEK